METRADLAEVYLNWGGYAYGAADDGTPARERFAQRLERLQAVLHNQDNREHDLLDSNDYYQFQGGMLAAVETLRGAPVASYHGDHSQPDNPRIRTLKEELNRVVRARAVNPKWIAGMKRHGYKGAFELAATVDYLCAFDATSELIDDHQYALLADACSTRRPASSSASTIRKPCATWPSAWWRRSGAGSGRSRGLSRGLGEPAAGRRRGIAERHGRSRRSAPLGEPPGGVAENPLGAFPAEAAVGDRDAVAQFAAERLATVEQVAFQHYPDQVAGADQALVQHAGEDAGLVQRVLAAVGVTAIDHHPRGDALAFRAWRTACTCSGP